MLYYRSLSVHSRFFWKASILGLCESITRRETCVVKVTVCIHVYFCRCVARLPLYRASLWFADAGRSSARRPLACKLWIGSWVQWISCWWRRMTGCRNRCPVWSMTTGTWRINFTVWASFLFSILRQLRLEMIWFHNSWLVAFLIQ